MIGYLENNVSEYSIKVKKDKWSSEFKEIVPEIMAKDSTCSSEFSKEFVRLVKELIK